MNLLKRFGYYAIGLGFGSLVVFFIWKGKEVSFDYGMDARTLKTIRVRERLFSAQAKQVLATTNIDSATIANIFKNGDVNFGKSKSRLKPCPEYFITGKDSLKNIDLYVIRCKYTSTIDKITIHKKE
ncbi:DUF4258 domain-containing protein [Tenacibaculum finnmarkense]|uniref:DUF4258 domain-containing protein n=1 Tax=Tenacibaculum finnmarkense TaxID=2781243 RepID=UPI00187B492E|nr:DUF4258 domain-containing protein [Tenacibaculum finnmarkense]MBE7634044.1 DUF4258 domain-containing protein [Tenacibaculum finnmarkense genomovar ulcerans]MBE7687511.1 DUF4258 domain-containing protein [Tenacibaculum finnmarkense genomovar ulcerans]MCD8409604.1 DUF4258 domain-containing protein [Tenacibaculum finnmarkense genomovar ulcerans]MCD8429800.1 DUF4258 domain-containing protein [Tenacibaculum finnmarkense genomovar ulcerans]MCG8235809.1 DUF4258 domain-containing protein [Tenacibac